MHMQRAIAILLALSASSAVLAWCLLTPPPTAPPAQPAAAEMPSQPSPSGMVWIPGGTFQMGSRDGKEDERPVHPVELTGFWMDATEVTNADFQRFTDATGYVTVAERTPKREDFVGVDTSLIRDEDLVPSSICFNPQFDRELVRRVRENPANVNWRYHVWTLQKGANWRHPGGPDSSIEDKLDHPVVHIAWTDAVAYCQWAGKRLPTEAEFEYASRGGLEQQEFPWGNKLQPGDKWLANIWQGEFPEEHHVRDGFETTAPVKSFPPNGYGLFDISGNVWEWCADWYQPEYYSTSPRRNPPGPRDSFDPNEPGQPKRVQRGGSFMCNANYCLGYRSASRMKGEPSSGAFHCGFRTVLSPADYEAFAQAPAQQNQSSR
jgi:formylglycine-generating enzyme required for sulfatase activity